MKQRLDIEIRGDNRQFAATAQNTVGVINRISGAASAMLGAIGVGFSIRKLIQWGKEAARFGSEVSDLAAQLGVSAETFQKFNEAAKVSGVTMQQLSVAMRYLDKSLGESLTGNRMKASAFQRLGLDILQLEQMDPERRFRAMADAIKGAERSPQLIADSLRLLGESAVPVVNAMAQGFLDVADSAAVAARVMREDVVNQLDRISDRMDEIEGRARRAKGELTVTAWDALAGFLAVGAAGVAGAFGLGSKRAGRVGANILKWFGTGTPLDVPGAGGGASATNAINTMSLVRTPTTDSLTRIGGYRGDAALRIEDRQLEELIAIRRSNQKIEHALTTEEIVQ